MNKNKTELVLDNKSTVLYDVMQITNNCNEITIYFLFIQLKYL